MSADRPEAAPKPAIVTAKVRVNERTIAQSRTTMSTDLPAEDLGQLVAEALRLAYEQGFDPVDAHVVVHFK